MFLSGSLGSQHSEPWGGCLAFNLVAKQVYMGTRSRVLIASGHRDQPASPECLMHTGNRASPSICGNTSAPIA